VAALFLCLIFFKGALCVGYFRGAYTIVFTAPFPCVRVLLVWAGVAAQVGDKPPVRSKVVACKAASRASLNPTFNQELWLPVTFPAMTSKVIFFI
jgi:hypothetical protein